VGAQERWRRDRADDRFVHPLQQDRLHQVHIESCLTSFPSVAVLAYPVTATRRGQFFDGRQGGRSVVDDVGLVPIAASPSAKDSAASRLSSTTRTRFRTSHTTPSTVVGGAATSGELAAGREKNGDPGGIRTLDPELVELAVRACFASRCPARD
jgi:hypothetical protein